MIASYTEKFIRTGDIFEFYEYEKPVIHGYTTDAPGRSIEANEEGKIINREQSMKRAQKTLRRLVNANAGQYEQRDKFITLTFSENIKDMARAKYEFKKFNQRLSYKVSGKKKMNLRYVCVLEVGSKGRIHFHVIYFGLPYIKNKYLAAIWQNGFVKINAISKVDNVGAYVCKYLTKTVDELKGQKSYTSSKNLLKPEEITSKKNVANLKEALRSYSPKYENTFSNDHNQIHYKQYIT